MGKFKIAFSVFMFIFGCAIGCYFTFYFHNKENNIYDTTPIDTTYNKITLDSIEYNIHIKDSIILKLKKKEKDDIEKIINSNDSIAFEQFKKLAGSD